MSNEPQTYPILYQVVPCEDNPQTLEQIKARGPGWGGTDAIVVHSIILPDDGSRSEMIVSRDGRTGQPLDDGELFKCMVSLAHQLSQSTELGEGRREFAKHIFEAVREAILAAREKDET